MAITVAKTDVPVEVLDTAIREIAQGVQKLLTGPLNEDTIVLLIQAAAPKPNGSPLSQKVIKAVLHGIRQLEAVHCKRKKA